MESQENQKQVVLNTVAVANLNLEQVQQALLTHLKNVNPQLSELLEGKSGAANFSWHVNKWDDKDKFCSIEIGLLEPVESPEEEESE